MVVSATHPVPSEVYPFIARRPASALETHPPTQAARMVNAQWQTPSRLAHCIRENTIIGTGLVAPVGRGSCLAIVPDTTSRTTEVARFLFTARSGSDPGGEPIQGPNAKRK